MAMAASTQTHKYVDVYMMTASITFKNMYRKEEVYAVTYDCNWLEAEERMTAHCTSKFGDNINCSVYTVYVGKQWVCKKELEKLNGKSKV